MTLSRQLKSPGRLILSPAVEPSSVPVSSSQGMSSIPSTALERARTFKLSNSEVEDGTGVAIIQLERPPVGFQWHIQRLVVTTTGGGSALLYVGGRQAANIVDLTASGAADVADESQPIFVKAGELIEVAFSGLAAGAVATANMQAVSEKAQA